MSAHTSNKPLILNLLHWRRITSYVVARKTKFSRKLIATSLTHKQLVSLDSSKLEVLSLLGCPSHDHLLAERKFGDFIVLVPKGRTLVKSAVFILTL